ncbi:MAG: fumarylacetoacetate hydrolase family protein [Candidatus Latescibacterota bacterium]|nr:fumarylacetoacetate hydrolase family protein [Candidatus Latescibacterota bacterium]
MKLLRFGERGSELPGLLDADGEIRDLSAHVDDIGGSALGVARLGELSVIDPAKLPAVKGCRLGPPVAGVGKFVCIGLNYSDHAKETGMPIPEEPIVFMKATSAINGPNDPIVIPRGSTKTDWEVELGVVIGSEAHYVSEDDALNHVAGYCTTHDVSERFLQIETGGQWTKGKSCDSFGPFGPYLVTRDEVPDPQNLSLFLDVDGHRYQDGNTQTMIFGVAFIIHYLSQIMSLQPGDIISTGTPPGVGMGLKPPQFLKAGQRVRLGVEGLGEHDAMIVDAS